MVMTPAAIKTACTPIRSPKIPESAIEPLERIVAYLGDELSYPQGTRIAIAKAAEDGGPAPPEPPLFEVALNA